MNLNNKSFSEKLLLLIAIPYSIFIIFYIVRASILLNSLIIYFIAFILVSVCIVCLVLWVKIQNKIKNILSKWIIITMLSILCIETHLEFKFSLSHYISNISNFINLNKDENNKTWEEIIEDLNSKGIDAFPEIGAMKLVEEEMLTNKTYDLVPLGGISNTVSIFLNNTAGKITYVEMDEHGFNNKKGLYNKDNVEIMLLGACIWEEAGMLNPYEENMGELLRKKGFSAINLSKAGNAPLMQLALIREYAKPLRPKVVLFLIQRDVSQAIISTSTLNKYRTNENFSQNLLFRQDEIDKTWINFIKTRINIKKENDHKKIIRKYLYHTSRILTLANIRLIYGLNPLKDHYQKKRIFTLEEKHGQEFEEIIVKSDRTVKEWGGQLYLVYQPQKENFIDGGPHYWFDLALKISKKNNIPIIDMNEKVFSVHPDPLSLLPFRKDPHVNAKANKLMAEVIANRVIRDGVLDPR